ncbi:uncharacterized protein BDW70DRAFT_131311 [Aspergillus foveolatus]|uniref:uncharacterized protein n=1 Tax=Aspergillus foveolatus TaxID=210207 RepID=UPI003CCDA677
MSSTSIPPESDSQLQPHNGAEKEGSVSRLQSHLNYLHSPTTPLPTVVQAHHWLLLNPDFHLTPSISPTGKRLITLTSTASADTTPSLTGTADLNTLGRIHLTSATRCRDEHATLKTRLLHVSLDEPIEKLYDASQKLLSEGLNNGTVRFPPISEDEMGECPCCRGDPDAVILFGFHHGNALYFEEDEYKAIWGDEEGSGLMSGSEGTWLMARKEMVERIMEAEEEKINGMSKL